MLCKHQYYVLYDYDTQVRIWVLTGIEQPILTAKRRISRYSDYYWVGCIIR
jgi:DNA/RNA endonuclease G (NUC1)